MAALRDELAVESSALLAITSHVKTFLDDRRSEKYYLLETNEFFAHIDKTIEAIHKFAKEVVACESPVAQSTYRRDISALKMVVGPLCRLARQVADADTLTIPFPIIAYINGLMGQFPEVSKVKTAKVLLLATDELNFMHRRMDSFRIACQECAVFPPFPENLGIIAFPYAERNSVCLNSLLFHELGHFVFQKSSVKDQLAAGLLDLDQEVQSITAKALLFDKTAMQQMARRVVLSWCEELFADLLATSIVGPSYAIAFDRLVRLTVAHSDVHTRFSERHPAHLFRKVQIARLLGEQGWLAAIEAADTTQANAEFVSAVRKLAQETTEKVDYKYPLDNAVLGKKLVDSFQKLVQPVAAAVRSIAAHLPRQVDDFVKHYRDITESLFHLVVPEVKYCGESPSVSPPPVTVLTCGSLVLTQDLTHVFEICGRQTKSVEDRLWVENRINCLVMKAMEDGLVLERWEQVTV